MIGPIAGNLTSGVTKGSSPASSMVVAGLRFRAYRVLVRYELRIECAGFSEICIVLRPHPLDAHPGPPRPMKPKPCLSKIRNPIPETLTLAETYQNLLFCRVPINSILGFIIRTHRKIGFGRLR